MATHQYSCLKNPMDRGAWWMKILGVARVQTALRRKPPPRPPADSSHSGFPQCGPLLPWQASCSCLFLPSTTEGSEGPLFLIAPQPRTPHSVSPEAQLSPLWAQHAVLSSFSTSHPTCLSGSPSPQLRSPCQYIFLCFMCPKPSSSSSLVGFLHAESHMAPCPGP